MLQEKHRPLEGLRNVSRSSSALRAWEQSYLELKDVEKRLERLIDNLSEADARCVEETGVRHSPEFGATMLGAIEGRRRGGVHGLSGSDLNDLITQKRKELSELAALCEERGTMVLAPSWVNDADTPG
jgi:hypothetical protein